MARYIPDAFKAEEMKKELQQKVIDLAENFKQNPQDIAEYLRFSSQFYNYSSRNSMLIRSQNPGAILCNSYKQYQNMGLQIKKGEHGMKILVPTYKTYLKIDGDLVPLSNATAKQKKAYKENKIESTQKLFFKVGTVFDISQTNCPVKDYPKYLDLGYKSEQHAQIYNTMKNFCEQQLNCPVHENAFSSVNMRGYYEPNTNSISLSGNFEDATRLSILSHELAHAVLHNDVKLERPTEQMEFEADAASVMLQSYFSIEIAESRLRHLSDSYNEMLSNKDITSKDVIQSLDRSHQAYKQVVTAVNDELNSESKQEKVQGKQKQSQPEKLNDMLLSTMFANQTASNDLQFIHKFYDDVDLLAKYEEKHNVPTNERLTEWFGDYGMNVPKKNVTPQTVKQRLKYFKRLEVNNNQTNPLQANQVNNTQPQHSVQSNSQSVQTQTPASTPQQPILPCQLPDMGMGGMNFGM